MFLLWSHGFSMCSLRISVLFVFMRVEISLFNSGILGSCGVFLLRSLSVLRILWLGVFLGDIDSGNAVSCTILIVWMLY